MLRLVSLVLFMMTYAVSSQPNITLNEFDNVQDLNTVAMQTVQSGDVFKTKEDELYTSTLPLGDLSKSQPFKDISLHEATSDEQSNDFMDELLTNILQWNLPTDENIMETDESGHTHENSIIEKSPLLQNTPNQDFIKTASSDDTSSAMTNSETESQKSDVARDDANDDIVDDFPMKRVMPLQSESKPSENDTSSCNPIQRILNSLVEKFESSIRGADDDASNHRLGKADTQMTSTTTVIPLIHIRGMNSLFNQSNETPMGSDARPSPQDFEPNQSSVFAHFFSNIMQRDEQTPDLMAGLPTPSAVRATSMPNRPIVRISVHQGPRKFTRVTLHHVQPETNVASPMPTPFEMLRDGEATSSMPISFLPDGSRHNEFQSPSLPPKFKDGHGHHSHHRRHLYRHFIYNPIVMYCLVVFLMMLMFVCILCFIRLMCISTASQPSHQNLNRVIAKRVDVVV